MCVVLSAVAVALLLLAPPQRARADTVRRSDPTIGSIQLLSQSYWISPAGVFDAHVKVATNAPLDSMYLEAMIFPHLYSRSALGLSFQNIEPSPPALYTQVPISPSGQASLSVQVSGSTTPQYLKNDTRHLVTLNCLTSCEGVYPVQFSLVAKETGAVVAQLTTQMLVVNRATFPLRFSWVLPLQASVTVTAQGVARLPQDELNKLAQLIGAIAAMPQSARPELAIDPATLAALDSSGPDGSRIISTLADWAETTKRVVVQPFAELDPLSLERAGLLPVWNTAVSLGEHLDAELLHVGSPTVWVAEGAIDAKGLADLPASVRYLVIPPADLVPVPSTLTPDHTFDVIVEHRHFQAMAGDPILESLLNQEGLTSDLAVHWLLAELCQTYLESPNSPTTRGIVLLIPPGSRFTTSFLQQFGTGLAASPVIKTVSLVHFFAQTVSSGSRAIESSQAEKIPRLYLPMLSKVARSVFSLAQAIPPNEGHILEEMLAISLSPPEYNSTRLHVLRLLRKQISAQLHDVVLGTDHTIALTSTTANVPLTIASNAKWPIRALLQLSSDKLVFPRGASRLITIQPGKTNQYSFFVRVRTSGDLPLKIKLTSPDGQLVFFDDKLTIRSTAVSSVALALTAGAIAYLLVWWLRSARRSRRPGRAPLKNDRRPQTHEIA
jgi:hypothetical protein